MKPAICVSIFVLVAMLTSAPRSIAQSGSIEFVARATPSSGTDEPVRGIPFYLLSKSFEDIGKEAEASFPPADMNAFIDKLALSKELKAWMKTNHCANLEGEDFVKKLKVDDVMNVPEFFSAYVERMAGDRTQEFPNPKYTSSDKVKHPAKYNLLVKQYHDAIRHYLIANPKSTDEIDLALEDQNPGHQWDKISTYSTSELHRHALDLARSKYLVARVDTDLQGQGALHRIAPGTYWLSTLDITADVGDARPRWDVRVTVMPGETAYVELSNSNAVQLARVAP